MSEQVHKRLTDEQVRMVLGRYVAKELTAAEAIELLGLKRRQFFEWTQRYKKIRIAFRSSIRERRRTGRLTMQWTDIFSKNWRLKRG